MSNHTRTDDRAAGTPGDDGPAATTPARKDLRRLAANLRWSWAPSGRELLASLPGVRPDEHPVATVDRLTEAESAAWISANRDALAAAVTEIDGLERRHRQPSVAYFCPEYGIAAELPQYSGGLGILAGDHLKAASDLGLDLVAVGLFYREGFFRQEIVGGAQRERIETVDPVAIGATDTGHRIEVTVDGEAVEIAVWELWAGATRMVLLDTDVEANTPAARRITNRLYAGDRRHRLSQELVLGAGGIKALRALDIDPGTYHLNEGHACFLLLELLAEHLDDGLDLAAGTERVREATLFTTHTPVPAGIDRFEQELAIPELEVWAERLGVEVEDLLAWANLPSDGPKAPFNTAALAFWFCNKVNGVSQLHATVSRDLFATLPRASGVEGITNGVHGRTWVSAPLQELYDETLGTGWANGDPEAWSRVDDLDGERYGAIRADARRDLVDLVYGLTGTQLTLDGAVFGFARRFATYKRAALLLQDPDGLAASLDAGAQFVFAGKAHPADTEGKAVLAELARFSRSKAAKGQLVLVPDYDIEIAKVMYSGCDVWLNNPIRPHEACGTSGEKAALNGVLNCSISDGWWADWYTDGIGWVIPTSDAADAADRDTAEAESLHRILNDDVLRLFRGDPEGWWAMTRRMLAHLGPLVTAGRMVAEYDRRYYGPIRADRGR